MATSSTDIVIGPWGGKGGDTPWIFQPDGRIYGIYIQSGDAVDSISFSYMNKDDDGEVSEIYGGNGGSLDEVELSDSENIIGISGTIGKVSNNLVITSLSFETNEKSYGPFGTEEGATFSVPVIKGKIVGFHGKHGGLLDSIGVILSP
ncbi:unnamed protein product [Lactuca saligna]|uniref:Jacalin-type lectin domain-containing protein n=1 Tax=Lactuca saligna TaxID=75948 RepID=A0AA35V8S3_LACSI|nr:unnamed protein product [Lactuca saligna]